VESIIVPICKKGDKTAYSNYTGILDTDYIQNFIQCSCLKVNSIHRIIGNHEYGFQCNRSTTDQTFCIHQILEKK
jgi:hypothetical protein